MDYSNYIRAIPDFPKPGIVFKDITLLLQNGSVFSSVISDMCMIAEEFKVDVIVGPALT